MILLIDAIKEAFIWIIRYLAAGICNLIYGLISWIYQVFMTVSKLNILSSEEIGPIYQRVTLILTIVMVFYITFEFVKYVVQPDTITDKEKGVQHIVTRMIIVIVLIAFVPRIFTMAYRVQNKLLDSQVFSKIILGKEDADYSKLGAGFSADMLSLFYMVDPEICAGDGGNYASECSQAENITSGVLQNIRDGKGVWINPGSLIEYDDAGETKITSAVKFDGLLAIVVGGLVLYILVLYCIDVGSRFAQLLFLQVISPIAIMGYISPKKDGMFQKWLKQCITTYLDLFIRLAIIHFVLLIVRVLGDSFSSGELFNGIDGLTWDVKLLSFVVLVIGLLFFAQRAPKLLQELFPSGGAASIGFGMNPKERWDSAKKLWNAGSRTVGGVAGAAAGAWNAWKNRKKTDTNYNKNWQKGLGTAFSMAKASARGLKAGAGKGGNYRAGVRAAHESVEEDIKNVNEDGTPAGRFFRAEHYRHQKTMKENTIQDLETVVEHKKTVSTATNEIKVDKKITSQKTDWETRQIGTTEDRDGAVKAVEKATRVFSVSDKSTPKAQAESLQTYKTSVGDAVAKVYGIATDAAGHAIMGPIEFDSTGRVKNLDQSKNYQVKVINDQLAAAKQQLDEFGKIESTGGTLTVEQKTKRAELSKITMEKQNTLKEMYDKILFDAQSVIDSMTKAIDDESPDAYEAVRNEVIEAHRVSVGTTYKVNTTDTSGNKVIKTKTVSEGTELKDLIEFAKDIGDIETSAKTQIGAIKDDPETRRANANASSGSDKK